MTKKNDLTQNRILLPAPLGQIRPCPIITDPQGCFTGKWLETCEPVPEPEK